MNGPQHQTHLVAPDSGEQVALDALERLEALSRDAMARLVYPVLPAREPVLAARLDAAPRHRALLRCWLASLLRAGALIRADDGSLHPARALPGPVEDTELDSCYRALGFPQEMSRLHRAALARLPELLSDRTAVQDVLFADTDVLEALGAYQRNVFTRELNARCGALVRDALRQHPGTARVVELGGGTGATTEAVLAALDGMAAEYVFTDVSRLFTATAEERFGVRTVLLDVDADFSAQGFPTAGADAVVAGNVLHNATDIPATLGRIRELLTPGGSLVLYDSVRDTDAVLTSMRFLLSPARESPHAADPRGWFTDQRAGTDEVFLTAEGWRAALREAGFELREEAPGEDSWCAATGQRLWHAVAPVPKGRAASGTVDPGAALAALFAGRGEATVCEIAGTGYDATAVRDAVAAGPEAHTSPLARRFFAALAALPPDGPAPMADDVTGPRTAVLAGEPTGARAAWGAWARGGFVLCVAPDSPPAALLALLERERITEAVLPHSLVRALPGAPTAALTDLSALRRVLCADAEPTAADAAAWRELGPTVEAFGSAADVRAEPVRRGHQHGDGSAEALVPDIGSDPAAAGDAALAGTDLSAAVAAVREVGRAALHTMLNALHRTGCLGREDARHTEAEILAATGTAPEQHRLLRRWLAVLAEEGLLHNDPADGTYWCPLPASAYASLDHVWADAERQWRQTHGSTATVAYARHCAQELPALLRGEQRPAALLFPEGRTDRAAALYRESVTARYQHHAAAALVAGELRARPPGQRARVLEAGGGTGTTTETVLPYLDQLSGPQVEYTFTDISPFFLDHARQRFGDRLCHGLLDIDHGPLTQGYAPASYDVLLAGGVLNAAIDTDASVRELAQLVVPGGLLVLTEPTREEYWVLVSQSFLLRPARDTRAATGTTFLTHDQWRAALHGAGLRLVADLPGPGHPLEPLGHRVFGARTPDHS